MTFDELYAKLRMSAFKAVYADLDSGVPLEDLETTPGDVVSNMIDEDRNLDQFAEDHGLPDVVLRPEGNRLSWARYYAAWYARFAEELQRGGSDL